MVVTTLTGAATDSGPADGNLISVDVAIFSGLSLLFRLMLADTLWAGGGVTSSVISSGKKMFILDVVLIVVVDTANNRKEIHNRFLSNLFALSP